MSVSKQFVHEKARQYALKKWFEDEGKEEHGWLKLLMSGLALTGLINDIDLDRRVTEGRQQELWIEPGMLAGWNIPQGFRHLADAHFFSYARRRRLKVGILNMREVVNECALSLTSSHDFNHRLMVDEDYEMLSVATMALANQIRIFQEALFVIDVRVLRFKQEVGKLVRQSQPLIQIFPMEVVRCIRGFMTY